MENTQYSPELKATNDKAINFLIFILVVITPIVYILILFLLDRMNSSNNQLIEPIPNIDLSLKIDLIFIILLGISILIIFATYWFILPFIMKNYQEKGDNFNQFKFILMFTINNAIVLFGLIIGILSWVANDRADWIKFLLFVGIGWIQMIYLYFWKIPKEYRKFS